METDRVTGQLFDLPEPTKFPRSMPLKQRKNVQAGLHPMGAELGPDDETCGTCGNQIARKLSRTYYKCSLIPMTFGPGTDIRLSWPACMLWKPKERT